MTATPQYLDKKIFSIVSDVAEDLGVKAFVIGGYVRDCFLQRNCNDIDIVVEGSGIDFATAVGNRTGKKVSYFKNFGTAMLRFGGDEIEFVGARKESYRRESRKPIVENGTLEDDQSRRDFTINAMAFSLQKDSFGELVDPFGGIKDLAAGIIRTPLDPDTTYSDDPLRMLRAVRFATKLSTPELTFTIVPESIESMRRMAERLRILSAERIADELDKMMVTDHPSMAFRLMDEAGLLPFILPELSALKGVESIDGHGHKDNFEHTLAVLDNVVAQLSESTASGSADTASGLPAAVSGSAGGSLSPDGFRSLRSLHPSQSPLRPCDAGTGGLRVPPSDESEGGHAHRSQLPPDRPAEGAACGAEGPLNKLPGPSVPAGSPEAAAATEATGDPKLWLRWAALLHDIGKPASKRFDKTQGWSFHGHEIIGSKMVPPVFKRLRLPIEAMKYVQKLVWLHLRPIALVDEEVTDSAVRRLLFDAGDDIDDLMALCNADITSKNPVKVAKIKANFELVRQKLVEVEAKDAIRNFKNPITGDYVMRVYGIPPCQEIGQLKEAVKEAILDGKIGNNFEEADALMRQMAPSLGLTATD